MRCSNSVEHQRSSRSVLERSSSSVSGSVAHREVNNAAQDPHRDAVRHRLQTTVHTATPHTTHSPMDGVAGWHSKATRCPRRWYITMISDLSIPSRQMELAERARRRGERLVREEDACGIPSSVDDETASNASETVSKVNRGTSNLQPRIGCTRLCLYRIQHACGHRYICVIFIVTAHL